jgi:hypothetical protein
VPRLGVDLAQSIHSPFGNPRSVKQATGED